jgi:hypothetical protein
VTRVQPQEPAGAGWLGRLRHGPISDVDLVRSACGIGACLLLATLLSYLRAWLAGTVKVDEAGLAKFHGMWIDTALVTCLVVAGGLHVRVCWGGARSNWPLLLGAGVAIQLAAAPALPLTSNDIFSNLANGRMVQHGQNPYVQVPEDLDAHDPIRGLVGAHWRDKPTPYGPIVTYISVLAAKAGPPWAAMIVFKAALLACSLGYVLLAYRFCRDHLPSGDAAVSFIVLGWNPLLAWEISGQAHNDGFMLLGTAGFVWAAAARREWLAWLALSLAFCAKIAIAPVMGLYLVFQVRRSVVRAAAMIVAGGALFAVLFAPFWQGPASLRSILNAVDATPDKLANSWMALICGGLALVAPYWQHLVFRVWTAAARLGFGVLAAVLAWRATTLPGLLADSVVFILLYQCLAVGWFLCWYATWLVPLAVGCRQIGLQRTVAVYCALVPLYYLPMDGFGISLMLAPVVPLVMLARDRSWLKQSLAS